MTLVNPPFQPPPEFATPANNTPLNYAAESAISLSAVVCPSWCCLLLLPASPFWLRIFAVVAGTANSCKRLGSAYQRTVLDGSSITCLLLTSPEIPAKLPANTARCESAVACFGGKLTRLVIPPDDGAKSFRCSCSWKGKRFWAHGVPLSPASTVGLFAASLHRLHHHTFTWALFIRLVALEKTTS